MPIYETGNIPADIPADRWKELYLEAAAENERLRAALAAERERWMALVLRARKARADPGLQWGQKRADVEWEAAIDALLEGPNVGVEPHSAAGKDLE